MSSDIERLKCYTRRKINKATTDHEWLEPIKGLFDNIPIRDDAGELADDQARSLAKTTEVHVREGVSLCSYTYEYESY